jgi:hypothetical protein
MGQKYQFYVLGGLILVVKSLIYGDVIFLSTKISYIYIKRCFKCQVTSGSTPYSLTICHARISEFLKWQHCYLAWYYPHIKVACDLVSIFLPIWYFCVHKLSTVFSQKM